jgi:hypothetical protein
MTHPLAVHQRDEDVDASNGYNNMPMPEIDAKLHKDDKNEPDKE